MHLTPSQTDVSDPEFDAFWDAYGKKVGKGAAEKAYKKARVFVHADVLLNAAIEHLAWQKRSGNADRFIPNTSTWLNEKRWMDERKEPSAQPASSKPSTTDARVRDGLALAERLRAQEQTPHLRAIGSNE